MPEGVRSIADMVVVVDANTEKLGVNMGAAAETVKKFAEQSGDHLAKFDKAAGENSAGLLALAERFGLLGKSGESTFGTLATLAVGMAEKANLWRAGLVAVSEGYDGIKEKALAIAEAGGRREEAEKLVSGIDDVVASVKEAAAAAGSAALSTVKGLAGGALDSISGHRDLQAAAGQTATAHEAASDRVWASAEEIKAGLNELSEMTTRYAGSTSNALNQAGSEWDRFTGTHSSAARVIEQNNETLGESIERWRQKAINAASEAMHLGAHEIRRIAIPEENWGPETVSREMGRVARAANSAMDGVPLGIGGDAAAAEAQALETLAAALNRLTELRDNYVERLKAQNDAEREAAEAAANDQFSAVLADMDKELAALGLKQSALAMSKGEQAEFNAVTKIYNELVAKGIPLTEESALKLTAYGEAFRKFVEDSEAVAKAQRNAEGVKAMLAGLEGQITSFDERAAVRGKGAAEAAGDLAAAQARDRLKASGLSLSEEQLKRFDALVSQVRDRAYQAKAGEEGDRDQKSFESTLQGLQRQTAQLREKTAALYDSSEAGKVNAMVERQIADLQARGVTITDARIAAIRREATANVDAAKASEEAAKAMQILNSYGQAVAVGLDSAFSSAFSSFARTGKFAVKDMVHSILADLALLTFKQSVTGPLQSLLSSAFSGSGGLMSSLLSSFNLAGARAGGGPVSAGSTYLVGERGPELFKPDNAGSIIPNYALGALGGDQVGGAIHVFVHATPELDARIEATAGNVVTQRAPGIAASAVQATEMALPGMMMGAQKRSL